MIIILTVVLVWIVLDRDSAICEECNGTGSVIMCFGDVAAWEPTPCPSCTTTFSRCA